MTTMRKSIAEHMVMSRRTSAHVTTFFEVDVTNVMKAREKMKAEFERSGVKLTVTPFFVQAAVNALKRFPIINASLDGDTIVYKRAMNIGIAVNLEWGLIVPVVKNADEKNLLGIARSLNELGDRARNKKLAPDDVKDGTFTITNGGVFGSLMSTPILNPPQVGILGLHKIEERPVAQNGQVVIRQMMYVALSYDHRVVDGRESVSFLVRVKELLENPHLLLFGKDPVKTLLEL